MELIRTFLAVPPDEALCDQLTAVFPCLSKEHAAHDAAPTPRRSGFSPTSAALWCRAEARPTGEGCDPVNPEQPDRAGPVNAVRWADSAGLHITLVFLGGTSAAQLALLHERIMALASTLSAFHYTLVGPLLFPDAHRPRVLVLEPVDDAGFAGWQAPLAEICEAAGFVREQRRYRPHLSLARIRRAPTQPLSPPAVRLAGVAREIVLYESLGGRYHPLFRLACGHAEQAA